MTTRAPVTVVHGPTPAHPRAPETPVDHECYRTDDGQILLVLPGDRPAAATALATSIGLLDPAVEVCERWDTVTTAREAPDTPAGFQVWITMTTTSDQQHALAEFNTAETRSTLQYQPGFRSVTVFTVRDRPVVVELVSWESEQHYAAATARPEFSEHHLDRIARMTTDTTWQRLWPCLWPCSRPHEAAPTRTA